MAGLKLVHSSVVHPGDKPGDRVEIDPGDTIRGLLADLDRGFDRDLGKRAAICIAELMQQRDQAMGLMLECSKLLKTALTNLNVLKAKF